MGGVRKSKRTGKTVRAAPAATVATGSPVDVPANGPAIATGSLQTACDLPVPLEPIPNDGPSDATLGPEKGPRCSTGGDGSHPNSVKSRFVKGGKGGPGRGKKAETHAAYGLSPLADMRHAYTNDATRDRTPGQRAARRMLAEDYSRFMTLMAKLEEAEAAQMAATGEAAGAEGPGERAAVELCERALAEFEAALEDHYAGVVGRAATVVGGDA